MDLSTLSERINNILMPTSNARYDPLENERYKLTKDKKIINFAIFNKVDFIGLSFIESAKSLKRVRDFIKSDTPKLVAKIENRKGLENLEEITETADCIMIDRGDLSTETDIENLAINQKKIIKIYNLII